MNIGDGLSTRTAMSAGTNQMEARSAISDSLFQSSSLTSKRRPISPGANYENSHDSGTDLRSVVERRYQRMNEAHDRIRTEVLRAHPPSAE